MKLADLLVYNTPKYVGIRDPKLGCLRYALILLIIIKFIVLNIFVNGTHLKQLPIIANSRIGVQMPVHNCNPLDADCNSDFTPMSELPYCLQYNSTDSTDWGMRQASCEYWDGPSLTRGRAPIPGALFIPTRVTSIDQKRGCVPSAENRWSCDTKPYVDRGPVSANNSIYIADVERFTLLIGHAFETLERPYICGSSSGSEAEFIRTKELAGIKLSEHQPKSVTAKYAHNDHTGAAHSHVIPDHPDPDSEFPSLLKLDIGDVVSVGDLLKLADPRGVSLLDMQLSNNQTLRWGGAVLRLTIEYDNFAHFDPLGNAPMMYELSASFLPMLEYKIMYEKEFGEDRLLRNVHGIFILINVVGRVRVVDFSHLMAMLTQAMVSLAIANTITDLIMKYCLPEGNQYNLCKYQPTVDFDEYRRSRMKLKRQFGEDYLYLDHKPLPHADILNKHAAKGSTPIDQDLMLILCKFEQRLNTIDAMDPVNTLKDDGETDNIGNYIRERERGYQDVGSSSDDSSTDA
mmetsp:Transcript_15386/g.33855  ORF Transcript_15386/g.33855 Transcript_15386/m.33855 type:complete len:516 (+) Transcript_15386:105-1652(+)